MGNLKGALADFRSCVKINDSIFSQSNKNKIAALENQRAIDLKNKEIENKELLLGNQRKRMGLLLACIASFAVLGILLYRQANTRKRLNQQLVKLNDELAMANTQKNRFFGILSHDLRSPIANLINFLHLQKAKPGLLSADQIAAREEKISGAAASVLQTMETILLWSKGQMEQFSPSMKPVPVAAIFDYLQHFFAGNERVHFTYAAAEGLTAFTDQQYLQTILQNIGSNAVKVLAAVDSPLIEWKAWKENDLLLITVTDNGPGAGEEKFRALYDEQAMTHGGSGLGLHIIRDLSKAIGCTVECSSQSGKGTVFTLSLKAAV
jgi:signal transduction histidine kinase